MNEIYDGDRSLEMERWSCLHKSHIQEAIQGSKWMATESSLTESMSYTSLHLGPNAYTSEKMRANQAIKGHIQPFFLPSSPDPP
jgi:hypothetical protein